MAFLDNSGDIILDAVLTDTGRKRLAQGDGTFNIVKFALGDDEINYELFDKNQTSAYQALSIFRTPILEAFANNQGSVKYKLISGLNQHLLWLPVINLYSGGGFAPYTLSSGAKTFIIAVDNTTVQKILGTGTTAGSMAEGILDGNDPSQQAGRAIVLDQGIDNAEVLVMPTDLRETQYIIRCDNRLGNPLSIRATGGGTSAASSPSPAFVDDDNIATYILTESTDNSFVSANAGFLQATPLTPTPALKAVRGAFGSRIQFKINASTNLRSSTELFKKLGSKKTSGENLGRMQTYYYLDSIINIRGETTGYSRDVTVRYVKAIV